MRRLAGLQEARQIMDPDEEDRREDEQRMREQKIRKLIAIAFQRIGLAIADDGITYYEDDREATVELDDNHIDLALLIALQTSGLAQAYEIVGVQSALQVVFMVDPALDHAVTR